MINNYCTCVGLGLCADCRGRQRLSYWPSPPLVMDNKTSIFDPQQEIKSLKQRVQNLEQTLERIKNA